MDIVKEYYGFSNAKAKEALTLLTKDQIETIRNSLNKGGRKRKWVKRLLTGRKVIC